MVTWEKERPHRDHGSKSGCIPVASEVSGRTVVQCGRTAVALEGMRPYLGQTAAPQSHRKNSEPVRGRGKSPASSGRPNPGRHLAGHAGGRRDAAGGVRIGSVERL